MGACASRLRNEDDELPNIAAVIDEALARRVHPWLVAIIAAYLPPASCIGVCYDAKPTMTPGRPVFHLAIAHQAGCPLYGECFRCGMHIPGGFHSPYCRYFTTYSAAAGWRGPGGMRAQTPTACLLIVPRPPGPEGCGRV